MKFGNNYKLSNWKFLYIYIYYNLYNFLEIRPLYPPVLKLQLYEQIHILSTYNHISMLTGDENHHYRRNFQLTNTIYAISTPSAFYREWNRVFGYEARTGLLIKKRYLVIHGGPIVVPLAFVVSFVYVTRTATIATETVYIDK